MIRKGKIKRLEKTDIKDVDSSKSSQINFILGLGFKFDRDNKKSISAQLYEQIRDTILAGKKGFLPGSEFPTTRDLAIGLKIGRNSVSAAIKQLVREDYIEVKDRSGIFVKAGKLLIQASQEDLDKLKEGEEKLKPLKASRRSQDIKRCKDEMVLNTEMEQNPHKSVISALHPCKPDPSLFPSKIFWKPLKTYLENRDHWVECNPQGNLRLRVAIRDYLKANRAIKDINEDQVIIVSGVQQAVNLAAYVLIDVHDSVWIENPVYLGIKHALLKAGADLIPVPVDEQGLNVKEGRNLKLTARMACVAPCHQFPMGVAMGLKRRFELLEWAKECEACILEDGFSEECVAQPIQALKGIDPYDRVIYIGTFNKILYGSLRLGYMVVPKHLVDQFMDALKASERSLPGETQALVADFMEQGHFMRHINQIKKTYEARRQLFLKAMKELTSLELINIENIDKIDENQGLQIVGYLEEGFNDIDIADRLEKKEGIIVRPLSKHFYEKPEKEDSQDKNTNPPIRKNGLIMGYTARNEDKIQEEVGILKRVLQDGKTK